MTGYTRLLGKRATFQPTTNEAVWQWAPTASLYVLVDPVRAGSGIAALAVDDLEAEIASINDRGILASPVPTVPVGLPPDWCSAGSPVTAAIGAARSRDGH